MLNKYEFVFLTRQNLSAREVDALSNSIVKVLKEKGGSLKSKEYWGLRKIAYKIKKNNSAHYVMLNINANPEALQELERVVRLNEDIIRFSYFSVKEFEEKTELFISENAVELSNNRSNRKSKEEEDK